MRAPQASSVSVHRSNRHVTRPGLRQRIRAGSHSQLESIRTTPLRSIPAPTSRRSSNYSAPVLPPLANADWTITTTIPHGTSSVAHSPCNSSLPSGSRVRSSFTHATPMTTLRRWCVKREGKVCAAFFTASPAPSSSRAQHSKLDGTCRSAGSSPSRTGAGTT